MLIRPIQPADYDEWLRMRRALWPETTDTILQAELVDITAAADNQAVFVAERSDAGSGDANARTGSSDAKSEAGHGVSLRPPRLGGFVELSIHPHAIGCDSRNVGYLEGWYVDEDLRRTGAGRQLVAAGEAWARSKGCREIASDTVLHNAAGRSAHLACGYTETERLVHFKKSL